VRLLTTALLLSVASVAGCTASSGATAHGTAAISLNRDAQDTAERT
jgi:phage-related tail protein